MVEIIYSSLTLIEFIHHLNCLFLLRLPFLLHVFVVVVRSNYKDIVVVANVVAIVILGRKKNIAMICCCN